mgnify:CR=1 FL=1
MVISTFFFNAAKKTALISGVIDRNGWNRYISGITPKTIVLCTGDGGLFTHDIAS